RIQNVVNELNGERIDVVLWDPEAARFVAHALSPAQVVQVRLDEETNTAEVVVPDRQLSLAIGKEGQNARLAAKLTGWRIDIKSQSVYEEIMGEEATMPVAAPRASAGALAGQAAPRALTPEQEAVLAFAAKQEQEAAAALAEAGVEEAEAPAAEAAPAAPQIRFAEELLADERARGRTKTSREEEEEAAKAKKARRPKRAILEEPDEEYGEYEFEPENA
ncbi:MAG: hypothetical protein HY723_03945, partial [Chloroflexi bacterium]|nr:hypothetical protein [Chloroflexota bacterium]